MSYFPGSRFGQDSPSRITTTSELLLEATEMPPVPLYQPNVPFYPVASEGSGGIGYHAGPGIDDGRGKSSWKSYPDRLDLYVYQGDDVQIPLYFRDPDDDTLDMSNENEWEWKAQVRTWHRWSSRVLQNVIIESEYVPPDPDDEDDVGQTLVTLFLPRTTNLYAGLYAYDLYSTSPYVGPDFPRPDDVEEEDWLQTQVKTWIYGRLYVVPRVTTTDALPPRGAIPNSSAITVTPTGVFGPNGRIP